MFLSTPGVIRARAVCDGFSESLKIIAARGGGESLRGKARQHDTGPDIYFGRRNRYTIDCLT